jgi:tRNA (cmo5U34)-methyltransferase
MNESSVAHVPEKEKWEFDASVADVFPDMLERSIPQYEVMRRAVTDLAIEFCARLPGSVVDLGSSRGDALAPLVERASRMYPVSGEASPLRTFFALEQSPPMLAHLRERFAGMRNVEVYDCDLRDSSQRPWGALTSAVTLSVLTLQFVPINYRQAIVRDVARRLAEGGAFILIEKVLGESADVDELMVRLYHRLKGENGYGSEQIERKRSALEGVLVPVTARWNSDLLRQAGFRHVDCFWRWMNFAGWLAIK